MPTADPTSRSDAPAEQRGVRRGSAPKVDSLLRSFLGTLLAVAVAALALWPHVRTLIE